MAADVPPQGPKRGTIPDSLEPELLRLAGEGYSTRKLAAWLGEQGCVTTHSTVATWLKEHREERAEVTRDVVRTALGKTVVADIDALTEDAELCRAKAREALARGEERLALSWTEQRRRTIQTKLHFSGADQPDGTGSLASFLGSAFPAAPGAGSARS